MNVRSQMRRRGSQLTSAVAVPARLSALEAEQRRTADAILELRRLGGRVSELADLVTELLVLAATREDPEFNALVKKYLEGV